MKFLLMILGMIVSAFGDIVITYIKTKGGKTSEWKKLLSGVLPMVFSYLESPINEKIKKELTGSEKFTKAVEMAERYLDKYVNEKIAKADIVAFVQHAFEKWQSDIINGKAKSSEVRIDGKVLTIQEAL